MGGRFTMSDDSHGIAQVATNYAKALSYLESLGITELWTLKRNPHPGVDGASKAKLEPVSVPVRVFRQNLKSRRDETR